MTTKTILSYEEITALIPHRFPMLLLDNIEIVELNQEAVGKKNVTINEWFFQGHFPTKPVMPGVLIVEALAQASATLVMHTLKVQNTTFVPADAIVYFMSITNTRFIKPVTPGDTLELKVTNLQNRGMVWRFLGRAYVNNELVTESEYKAMIVDNPNK